jgi:diguanylate cyclase (GGDEF)-like protein
MTKIPKNSIELNIEVEKLKTKIKQLNSKLSMRNAAFLNFMDESVDGIVIIDAKKKVLYANKSVCELLHIKPIALMRKPLDLIVDPTKLPNHYHEMIELSINNDFKKIDKTISLTLIETQWGKISGYLLNLRDLTEEKKSLESLNYITCHDALTDLHNRTYLEKQLEKTIHESVTKGQHFALLYLDLDNFKIVNDTLGHSVGDCLLKAVSMMLKKSIRRGDTISRLGGDEFAIILRGLRKPDYAAVVSNNILDGLNSVFNVGDKEIYTTVSIGIAVYPFSGVTVSELIKNADTAMYEAKKSGKNQYHFFSPELTRGNEEKLTIYNGLRNVTKHNELFLEYQPIIDVKTTRCVGVEALVRWQHPTLGLIPPNHFLHYAEEAGLMIMIGQWVIQRALEDYDGFKNTELFLSINLSANELNGEKMGETIFATIQKYAIPSDKIVLEITETSMMQDPEDTVKKFNKLSHIGVKIAIDDYGSGYSSLSYLRQLPVSFLKIDKSFIDDIALDVNIKNTIIVKSTIELAHSLNLKVIAEGVETKEQVDFLKKHGCDYIQGFYFSKPLGVEALKKFIR